MFSKTLVITNRLLCTDFFVQIEKIANLPVKGIILREKDLSFEEYKKLAFEVQKICIKKNAPLILHTHYQAALELSIKKIHMPLLALKELKLADKKKFSLIGTSCHNKNEIAQAEVLNANYAFIGNIFETDCKKGLVGKGIDFLNAMIQSTKLPLYALGGITPQNAPSLLKTGIAGIGMMSYFMQAETF